MTDTQYVCVAPAIDVVLGVDENGEGGTLQRVHRGGGLPLRGLYQKQIDHLLARDMIVAAEVTGGLHSVVVDAALALQSMSPAQRKAAAKASAEAKAKQAADLEAQRVEAERVAGEQAAADAKAKADADAAAKANGGNA